MFYCFFSRQFSRVFLVCLLFALLLFCQDCLVYLLNREQHTVGQETASARPNICLSSPDVLPLHCRIRRAPQRRSSSDQRLLLEPIAHGNVLVNFMRIERPTPLRHGDLLSFGAHYIFLYKDPLSAKPLPAQSLTRLRALARLCDSESGSVPEKGDACRMCGAVLHEPVASRRSSKTPARGAQKRKLALEFERAHEDALVNRVLTLIEPSGDDHKLTPAYLLCLCIKHSANIFPPGSFGKLLLKIAKRIQTIAWVSTHISRLVVFVLFFVFLLFFLLYKFNVQRQIKVS